jgi:hypothetical protein
MNVQEMKEIRELTSDEIELVSGGASVSEVVGEVVGRAQGLALFMWDLCTNWSDPWA